MASIKSDIVIYGPCPTCKRNTHSDPNDARIWAREHCTPGCYDKWIEREKKAETPSVTLPPKEAPQPVIAPITANKPSYMVWERIGNALNFKITTDKGGNVISLAILPLEGYKLNQEAITISLETLKAMIAAVESISV